MSLRHFLALGDYAEVIENMPSERELIDGQVEVNLVPHTTTILKRDPMMTVLFWIPIIVGAYFILDALLGDNGPVAFLSGIGCEIFAFFIFTFWTLKAGPVELVVLQFLHGAYYITNTPYVFFPGYMRRTSLPGDLKIDVETTMDDGHPRSLSTLMRQGNDEKGNPLPSTKVFLKAVITLGLDITNRPQSVIRAFLADMNDESKPELPDLVANAAISVVQANIDAILQTQDVSMLSNDVKTLNNLLEVELRPYLAKLGIWVRSVAIRDSKGDYFDQLRIQAEQKLEADTRRITAERERDAGIAVAQAQRTQQIESTKAEVDAIMQTAELRRDARITVLNVDRDVAIVEQTTLKQLIKVQVLNAQRSLALTRKRLELMGEHKLVTVLSDALNQNAAPEDIEKALVQLKDFVKVPQHLTLVGIQEIAESLENLLQYIRSAGSAEPTT